MFVNPSHKELLCVSSLLKLSLACLLVPCFLACSNDTQRTSMGRSKFYASLGVNDLSNNSRAAAAVAAQTETENGRAPGACLDILIQHPQDVLVNISSENELEKMQGLICSIDDSQMMRMLRQTHRSSSSDERSFSLIFDALSKYGKNKLDLAYNQEDAQNYDDTLALHDAKKIRKVFCNDDSSESFRSRAVESFKSIASAVTLDKYNACVRAKSYGLRCSAVERDEHVAATVRWEPTELVRSYLPRVALDWSGLVNLSATDKLPTILGLGSGTSVSLVKNNKNAESVLGISAFDASGHFSFACNMAVDPEQTQGQQAELKRDPACGVELFKEAAAPACGVESYKLSRSEVCGVELHKEQRSLACGIERYNSRHDCNICGQAGPFGGCKQCEHPSFGVGSYRSCRHADHGAESYLECRSPEHGVAEYKKCRRREFGVEQYKECLVTKYRRKQNQDLF
jgi:hypothetical protein